MKMKMKMSMINFSGIDIEAIRTVFVLYFFFMKDLLNIKNTNKSIFVTFNEISR